MLSACPLGSADLEKKGLIGVSGQQSVLSIHLRGIGKLFADR
jgi:hypothetical protein